MITERDDNPRNDRAPLAWSLLVSVLLNLLIWSLVTGRFGIFLRNLRRDEQPKEFVISSSALQIEPKTVPQPRAQPARPQAVQPPAQPAQTRHAIPQPQAQPTELAHIVPKAPPQPRTARTVQRPATLAEQLAQQQVQFTREAQRMDQRNSPISIATPRHFKPSTFQRTYMDMYGKKSQENVMALLTPLPGEHWYANGMSCYYVHYDAQFSGGGTEDGDIPWPVCYPAAHDAMLPLDRPHALPVPAPPIGFRLPPNATLGPLMRDIYTGKIHN